MCKNQHLKVKFSDHVVVIGCEKRNFKDYELKMLFTCRWIAINNFFN